MVLQLCVFAFLYIQGAHGDSFSKYLDELTRNGLKESAIAFSADSSVVATHPATFLPSPDEIKSLFKYFDNPASATGSELVLNSVAYPLIVKVDTQQLIAVRNSYNGVVASKTTKGEQTLATVCDEA